MNVSNLQIKFLLETQLLPRFEKWQFSEIGGLSLDSRKYGNGFPENSNLTTSL